MPAVVRVASVAALAVILSASYCLAYTAAGGSPETLGEALEWSVINVAPWAVAAELARQTSAPARIAAVLMAALASVVVLQAATGSAPAGVFWLVRALPGMALALVAIAVLRALERRKARRAAGPLEPAAAHASQWIAAAGNYVELHGPGRVSLARSTLAGAAEAVGEEFVRVHRSYLVRRSAIRRIDRESVLLACGKRLPVGAAFRASLEAR